MLLGIIFITITLHKRTQSIQKTSVKEIQQFSNEKFIFAVFLSVKVGAPAGGRKLTATTFLSETVQEKKSSLTPAQIN